MIRKLEDRKLLFLFYTRLLDSAVTPSHLYKIHTQLLTTGLIHSNPIFPTKIIHLCSRLLLLSHAQKLFDQILHPNTFHFNAILNLNATHKQPRIQSLNLYSKMLFDCVSPDAFTFPPLLKLCVQAFDVKDTNIVYAVGKPVHAHILRFGFASHVFLQNGLLVMYGKCGMMTSASSLFQRLFIGMRNVVSWTAMISGYVQNSLPIEAIRLFKTMIASESIMKPDFVVIVSVLKGFMNVQALEQGRSIHAWVIKLGLKSEIDVSITLTAMYSKCGDLSSARSVFDQCWTSQNVMLWNAMISGYAKTDGNGNAKKALELFRKMINIGLIPDSITLRSVILACTHVNSIETANWVEDYTFRRFKNDLFVNTALIDMYSKCGHMGSARRVFDRITDKDTVSYSAMIVGYGLNGHGLEAMRTFDSMKHDGIRPNDVTFLGLLLACSHGGLVEQGWIHFKSMRSEYGLEPQQQHYSCMVDLLARAGKVGEAYDLISQMEESYEVTVSMWGALLNACKIHGHVDLGAYAAARIFEIDASNAGHYVQLSNLYAGAGMWEDASKTRLLMKEKGVSKSIGVSLPGEERADEIK
ncbi:Pentatricopeptide repeat-containing protein [Zostera marina]|uniref:Pentatricopeptide repeat-containing protein n=1 Tax=Zostera marina TaxID=29655 RepID=A0A0K9PPR6_ZOSMR|nr:Pentatricopeptide repeat-containing protein [Zostera marina]